MYCICDAKRDANENIDFMTKKHKAYEGAGLGLSIIATPVFKNEHP